MRKGDLISVKPSATEGSKGHNPDNRELVEEHGWLWIVEQVFVAPSPRNFRAWCRSVATGGDAVWWENEVEIADEEG